MGNDSKNDGMTEFEQALQENLGAQEMRPGELVKGTIVAIHGDVAMVDVGGKSEAVLPREELDELGVGDPVEVVVTDVGEELRVSRRQALERALKEELREAAESGAPVEGKVVGRRKGGFDVTIAGVRGFCPASQIDDVRTPDLDAHLGQVYEFKVLEYAPEKRQLVVSRAALLRERKEKAKQEAWERLNPGDEVDGTVRSLTDFGAFVDLGGVDGLVHVTELSHRRVRHPREVLQEGESVRVKILDMDPEKERISLSMKALQDDPWAALEERMPVGSEFEGKVVRKADFGVFVEIQPGLDGLLHSSQLPPGMSLDAEELAPGATIKGWVREVDPEQRRLSLTLRPLPDRDPWENVEMRYQPGQVVEAVVENGAPFGVFVEVEPGLSALVPISELGMGRDVDPKTALEPGSKIQAKVLSVDPERRRMSLSIRAFKRDQERQEYSKHMSSGEESSAATAFGAKLMEALKGGKKN
jgi:small subunit ribosomal protein S1